MSTNPSNPVPTLERDPVCGMNVNPATAKHVHNHRGKNFYFCCAPCVEKFKADPAKYLAPRPSGLVTLGAA
jgi:Cu+-exporting ATPase